MSEELMRLTNGTEKESPKPNHYVDDPSFIREEETPEAREKQFKEMQRSMRPGYVRLRSMEEIYDTVYLGHSDIQTTSNIYTHLSWDDKTETLEAMEKAVKLPEFDGTKSAWDSVKMPKTS